MPFSETVNLVTPCASRDVKVEPLVFPDEVHDFLLHARWIEAYRATTSSWRST